MICFICFINYTFVECICGKIVFSISMNNLHTYVFGGFVIFQFLFIAFQYYFFRRKEFAYYFVYIFCVSVYIIMQAAPELNPLPSTISTKDYFTLNRAFAMYSFALYFLFGLHFCNIESINKQFAKQLKIVSWAYIAFGTVELIISYIAGYCFISEMYLLPLFVFVVLYSFYLIYYLYQTKNTLIIILILGSFFLLFFTTLSVFYVWNTGRSLSGADYMLYDEIGAFLEFVCLNFGLVYKTKLINEENKAKEIENIKAIHQERNRISSELHDDIGGSISTIKLISELMQIKSEYKSNKELQTISNQCAQLSQSMNEIVWSLNMNNDTLLGLISYIRPYFIAFFDTVNINAEANTPEIVPNIDIDGITRRNIFLIVKEVCNNIIKHANASKTSLTMIFENKVLTIIIADNGIGFCKNDNHNNRFGIQGLYSKVYALNGKLRFENNNGTTVVIEIPFELA